MRVISYGGGVQSTALCVLAVQGKIGKVDAALFANVGDDSEHPATCSYVREQMLPWCAERGLDVHELHRVKRDGSRETLMENLLRPASRAINIPVRMPDAEIHSGVTMSISPASGSRWRMRYRKNNQSSTSARNSEQNPATKATVGPNKEEHTWDGDG